jgi:hypothetical protein
VALHIWTTTRSAAAESSASSRSALDPDELSPAGSGCRRRRQGWLRNRLHGAPGRRGRLDASLARRSSTASCCPVIRSSVLCGGRPRDRPYRGGNGEYNQTARSADVSCSAQISKTTVGFCRSFR